MKNLLLIAFLATLGCDGEGRALPSWPGRMAGGLAVELALQTPMPGPKPLSNACQCMATNHPKRTPDGLSTCPDCDGTGKISNKNTDGGGFPSPLFQPPPVTKQVLTVYTGPNCDPCRRFKQDAKANKGLREFLQKHYDVRYVTATSGLIPRFYVGGQDGYSSPEKLLQFLKTQTTRTK